jgi:hypothetical protein
MAMWEYILAKELFEFKEWMGGKKKKKIKKKNQTQS